ncbi:hypothetical protein HKX42_00085 [Salinisphaera sp. USBA-960]|nr:hypothetical protein [Salifodinibacter halophilus]NNC25289.1 hypothetical protein [Salifodinibacter halophilus]
MAAQNFEAWINDADMPEKQNGVWRDLETGFAYDPKIDYVNGGHRSLASKGTVSQKAEESRAAAKMFGGIALTGSKKQKDWGEDIRADKIKSMDIDQAEMACDRDGLGRTAKFWIENRKRSGREFGEFFQAQKALLKQHKTARANGDETATAEIASKYNALTTEWGF